VVREKRKRRGEKRGGGRGEGQIREQKGEYSVGFLSYAGNI
jgi:hypothetical protein